MLNFVSTGGAELAPSAAGDRRYEVVVQVSDGQFTRTQQLMVTVGSTPVAAPEPEPARQEPLEPPAAPAPSPPPPPAPSPSPSSSPQAKPAVPTAPAGPTVALAAEAPLLFTLEPAIDASPAGDGISIGVPASPARLGSPTAGSGGVAVQVHAAASLPGQPTEWVDADLTTLTQLRSLAEAAAQERGSRSFESAAPDLPLQAAEQAASHVHSTAAVTVVLSLGAVGWAARGAMLASSVLISGPAWRSFDLLPVLQRRREDADWGDGDGDEPAPLGDLDTLRSGRRDQSPRELL